VIFALENAVLVTMSFFGSEVEGSLALFILLAVLLGVIIGMLVMMPGTVRHSLELRSNRKRIGDLERSLNEQKGQAAKERKIEPFTDFPEDDKV
jgi:hypothetical protein